MIVEIAALCDAATDQGGRLNILGAFDRIIAPLPLFALNVVQSFESVTNALKRLRILSH
jgi:hypothetical protein